ncbi:MAG TPA: antibiotic biosynthesis monooxygenase [Syntrophales bacterium]|nr:antibiotic biosynthesis monooxygenase [Syntrophales bacterium]HOM07839.1 antibiotic biosynthesis monooxygenase [Syntrophales bacterium]HOO00528.1 antibiotic biosynthesis monooxygenase [Syntrophales bacterium]HPC01866.1 antibiotic biosynthesis monooxygenase [Syntrophales bacterium]HPQ07338.1 antibiotic biosynthesis monooxygenase [Syntrophales bacterium]
MAVKIFIRRRIPKGEDSKKLFELIKELRRRATGRPGYISGESLVSVDDPSCLLVVSTWRHMDDWKAWENDPERMEIQKKIDEIIGAETVYEGYHYYEEKTQATLRGYKGWEGG